VPRYPVLRARVAALLAQLPPALASSLALLVLTSSLLSACPSFGDRVTEGLGANDGARAGVSALRTFASQEPGVLTLSTGASLSVPAGALPRAGTLSLMRPPDALALTLVEGAPGERVSAPYVIDPAGLTFHGNVLLRLPLLPGRSETKVDLLWKDDRATQGGWITLGALTVQAGGFVELAIAKSGVALLVVHADSTPEYVAPSETAVPAQVCADPPCCPAFRQRVEGCGFRSDGAFVCGGDTIALTNGPDKGCAGDGGLAPVGLAAVAETGCRVIDDGQKRFARVCCPDGTSAKFSYGTSALDASTCAPSSPVDAGVRSDAGDAGSRAGRPELIGRIELDDTVPASFGSDPPGVAWLANGEARWLAFEPGRVELPLYEPVSADERIENVFASRGGLVFARRARDSIVNGQVVTTESIELIGPPGVSVGSWVDHAVDLTQCIDDGNHAYCGSERFALVVPGSSALSVPVGYGCKPLQVGQFLCPGSGVLALVDVQRELEQPFALTTQFEVYELAVVGDTVYAFDGEQTLYAVPRGGGSFRVFATLPEAPDFPFGLGSDSQNLYAYGQRVPLNGSPIARNFYEGFLVAESAQWLYHLAPRGYVSGGSIAYDIYRTQKVAP
jgi:hypothetical protein